MAAGLGAEWAEEKGKQQFGRLVFALRKAKEKNQEDFASAIEIGETTLRELEQGQYFPNLEVVVRLARFVGVPLYRVIQAWIGEGDDVADFTVTDLQRIVAYRNADDKIKDAVDRLLDIVPHDPGVKKTG